MSFKILHTPLLKIFQKLHFLRVKSKLLILASNIPNSLFSSDQLDISYNPFHGSLGTGTWLFDGPFAGIASADTKRSARFTHFHLKWSNATFLMRSTLSTSFQIANCSHSQDSQIFICCFTFLLH